MNSKLGDTTYLLFMRWVLVNTFGIVMLWVIWRAGWTSDIIATDSTYVARIIVLLFLSAVTGCTWRLLKTSHELNITREYTHCLKRKQFEVCEDIEVGNSRLASYLESIQGLDASEQRVIADVFRMNMMHKISSVGYNLNRLTMLGLIGTVIGMVLALKGFDPKVITDQTKIIELFRTVPPGLHNAVYATLVGSVAAFWLGYLFEILQNGTTQLVSEIIKAGVYRGRSE